MKGVIPYWCWPQSKDGHNCCFGEKSEDNRFPPFEWSPVEEMSLFFFSNRKHIQVNYGKLNLLRNLPEWWFMICCLGGKLRVSPIRKKGSLGKKAQELSAFKNNTRAPCFLEAFTVVFLHEILRNHRSLWRTAFCWFRCFIIFLTC